MLIGDPPSPEAEAVSSAMRAAWAAFAIHGDPGWPAYDTERRATQIFDGFTNPVVDDPMGDERALWDPIAL